MKEKIGFHHGNLKNEMIEQGIEIIKNEGITGISLKKIAKKCGVSSSSTYRHFKNKQDLIENLFSKVSGLFNEYILVEITVSSPIERLTKMGVNFVNFSKDYPNYYEFLFQSPYTVSVRMKKNGIELTKQQAGFIVFENEVREYLDYYTIHGDLGQHVLQLWAYISGLSMIVSERDSPFTSKELIQKQIENMLEIYTRGTINQS